MRFPLLVAVLAQSVCAPVSADPSAQPTTAPVAEESGAAISKRILATIPKLPKKITLDAAFERFGVTDDTPLELVGGGSDGPGGLDHDFVFALGEDQSHLLYVEGSSTLEDAKRAAQNGETPTVNVTTLRVTTSGPRDDADVPTQGEQLLPFWKYGTVVSKQSEGQQGGAGQPATAAEAKPENEDKPQPESKPGPR